VRRFLGVLIALVLVVSGGAAVAGRVGLVSAVRGEAVQVRTVTPLPRPFDAQRVTWPGPGQVAVTFDDGPCRFTRDVVDAMGDRVATFYVVGVNIERDPLSLRYAAERGHSVQNHSMRHRRQTALPDDEIVRSLESTAALIEGVAGVRPSSFRPPYGVTNSRVLRTVNEAGYSQALWNGGPSTMSAGAASIVSSVASQVARAVRRGEGLVILFHDCSGRPNQLLAALPDVLSLIDSTGLEYVALS